MSLREQAEPLAYELALALLDEPEGLPADLALLGRRSRDIGPQLRAMAILVLLTRADGARFRDNLRSSAALRHQFLQAAAGQGAGADAGREWVCSRLDPLFDALAAGDTGLAQQLAALSPTQWQPDGEYEDDYCYARLLFGLLPAQPVADEQTARTLARFEAVLAGAASPRLACCRALYAADGQGWAEAFDSLLQQRTRDIAERVALGELDEVGTETERLVFIEGLALLALAEARGLATDREYLYCPGLARLPRPPAQG